MQSVWVFVLCVTRPCLCCVSINEWLIGLLTHAPFCVCVGKCFVKPKGGFEMNVEGLIYADQHLAVQIIAELKSSGSFLPALKQVANVACLPGIVGSSLGMPDIHSGYGFAVGCVAAMDTTDPNAVVSPGGVGFDINCGVRLLRSNLKEGDLYHNGDPKRLRKLATALYDAIPTGVGSSGAYIATEADLKNALKSGMRWCLESGYCWLEDLECCEEQGCFKDADPNKVSSRARKRGMPQMGTLGSGNHYIEVQVVDEVFDEAAASAMGLEKGNVCIMIHSGSRGLGHQVCTDALQVMESSGVKVPDRQLSAVRIKSPEGQNYLQAMAAAANYAFVNRTLMAHSARKAVTDVFDGDARELGLYVVYDVAHNIAKVEEHRPAEEGGPTRILLVHRKGATRAFPPGHPEIPEKYRGVGQPVLIGGSMGTCSYVLTGTHKAMEETFGSTCHGAGRALSRSQALRENDSNCVLNRLRSSGIEVRIAQPRLAAEEADVAYKDVESVVATCHEAGISKKTVRLRPLAVIKG
mmetsp:Transcript_44297/g.125335  ORF Transcript_44297/g.125335 Transcript_44297/m.125335 type:complete len:524 (-) Transcript_44297:382-1953(-)